MYTSFSWLINVKTIILQLVNIANVHLTIHVWLKARFTSGRGSFEKFVSKYIYVWKHCVSIYVAEINVIHGYILQWRGK